jgi:phosphate/sulfate permease
MELTTIFSLIGFALAGYAVVANDVIQTLGTFLTSNAKRPWILLWFYAAVILSITLISGWYFNHGDVSFGRLSKIPLPEQIQWWYILPPLVLLVLTQLGLPVSTTFMVLSVFSTSQVIEKMVIKSVLGYAVAFTFAFLIYLLISRKLESKSAIDKSNLKNQKRFWIIAQWFSTAFLWTQWLIQDFANIFVYLPRQLNLYQLLGSLLFIVVLLAFVFQRKGGKTKN